MTKIVLINSDANRGVSLYRYLLRRYQGSEVSVDLFNNGLDGLHALYKGGADIVVVDLDLADTDGLHFLSQIRDVYSAILLVMVSDNSERLHIQCIDAGADSCIVKPISPEGVYWHIKAIDNLLQRKEVDNKLNVGDLIIIPSMLEVTLSGEPLDLTVTEFNLLHTLVKRAGNPVGKEQLSMEALKYPYTRDSRSIDVHVSSIRHKMAEVTSKQYIKTVRGQGYLLIKPRVYIDKQKGEVTA